MFFVESVLGELNEFNTIFQSEKPLFHLMKTQVEKTSSDISHELYEAFIC